MSLHVSNANGEWTHTGIALCAFGLCLLVTVVISIYKLVKG